MGRVLLTGFEPFGGEAVNPAARAVSKLAGKSIDGYEIIARVIPTVFGKSAQAVQDAIREFEPEVVISVGQAGGTHSIRVERLALNLDDASIPDNEGNQPRDSAIVPDGPVAYWSTLPVRAIVETLTGNMIPAYISYSAGTYVCNHVFYATSHFVAANKLPIKVGFIHVPYLPEQVVRKPHVPSMSEEMIVQALEIAVAVSVSGGQAN
ncbi:MAG TPA: pyroglutamyl-peptidase I [Bacillota bacterium]|nr:pyroglutamyl-peptidase I [Candidatus Fermentithermobacillaceae bacterium]HPZ84919.1 pyroglutamyl-peptidase I [Bacillota bacterium]